MDRPGPSVSGRLPERGWLGHETQSTEGRCAAVLCAGGLQRGHHAGLYAADAAAAGAERIRRVYAGLLADGLSGPVALRAERLLYPFLYPLSGGRRSAGRKSAERAVFDGLCRDRPAGSAVRAVDRRKRGALFRKQVFRGGAGADQNADGAADLQSLLHVPYHGVHGFCRSQRTICVSAASESGENAGLAAAEHSRSADGLRLRRHGAGDGADIPGGGRGERMLLPGKAENALHAPGGGFSGDGRSGLVFRVHCPEQSH